MSTKEQIAQLTAQVVALQAQLAHCSWSPPPPQPSTAPTPPLEPPKVTASTPFSGTQDDLDHFKAECSLCLSMRSTEFPDKCKWSNILFVLSYMKGGTTGPWATQKINLIVRVCPHMPDSVHTLMCCCVLDSMWLHTLCDAVLPPASMPPHVLHVCLFSSFIYQRHVLLVCLLMFPSSLLPLFVIVRQWANVKSDHACHIKRGLGRRLRSSL